MKKALLPALIASLFTATGSLAADRELLFGPGSVSEEVVAPKRVPPRAVPLDRPSEAPKPKSHAQAVTPKEDKSTPSAIVKAEPKVPQPKSVETKATPRQETPKPVVTQLAPTKEPAPAPIATPVAVAVAAPAVKASVLPAKPLPKLSQEVVKIVASNDPLTVRQDLAAKLKQSVAIGFFPPASENNDIYSFARNYMPLANHLSQQTSILVNFVPERSPEQYRSRIVEGRYPAIFIDAGLAREAMHGRYVPLVKTMDQVAPAFIVRADSPIKSLDDIKNVNVAWNKKSTTTFLALAEFAARDSQKTNKFIDVDRAGSTGVVNAIKSRVADVAILSVSEAENIVREGKGDLRFIGAGSAAPSGAMWVREDLVDSEFAKRLASAMINVSPDTTGSAKVASDAFARGFGVKGQFTAAPATLRSDLDRLQSLAEKGAPESFPDLKVDERVRSSNLSRAVIETHAPAQASDPVSVRKALADSLSQSITVGFFPSVTGNNDTYSFVRNYMPLANHLSQQTSVLINLVPERDLDKYRTRIVDGRYPVIFINAALAREAIRGGYVPLAVGAEQLAPGFVVKASSPIKSIDDIKNVNIAWSKNAQVSFLAMADFAARNLDKTNKFTDVGGAGRVGALNAVRSGSADLAILRASEAEAAVRDSQETLRYLGAGSAAPSSGMWVRKDLVGSDFANKLSSALLMVSPEASGAAKVASVAFSNGFGIKGQFVAAPANMLANLEKIQTLAEQGFPEQFSEVRIDERVRAANLNRAVFETRQRVTK